MLFSEKLNNVDRQYLQIAYEILNSKSHRKDRTGTGTIAQFGKSMRFDLKEGFPLLTTKKVNFDAVLHELIWFLRGDTNIKYLVDNNVNIWNSNAKDYYEKNVMKIGDAEFLEKVKSNDYFAGDCGRVYGYQWREFDGYFDQIRVLIDGLKNNPDGRRHVVTAWNPCDLINCALPPCHIMFQCDSILMDNGDRELSLIYYMRSNDFFLGAPFNIASYALLTHVLAELTNHKVGELIAFLGNTHIYKNHIKQMELQIERGNSEITYELPQLKIKTPLNNIDYLEFSNFSLENYYSHKFIKAEMSV